jgi:hypothetical protein
MLKDRRSAAMNVAKRLFAAEEAIDLALARASELNGTLVSARTEAKLSATVGQDAFDSSASAFAALVRARTAIVETHNRLTEAQVQIGLRAFSFGDLRKPSVAHGDRQHLQAVS